MLQRAVEVIGVPTNSSGTTAGVARAPAALRRAGLLDALGGLDATDAGDLALPAPQAVRGPSGLLAESALVEMVGAVRGAVGQARTAQRFPLVVGGDCPAMLGALAALTDVRLGLLFLDGHEDAWPPRQSTTGEAADCELGLVVGVARGELDPRLRAVLPRLDPATVVAVGPLDLAEITEAGVASVADGLAACVRPDVLGSTDLAALLDALPGAWWLHVDVDVLSTESLAAVDYPQPGGLDWEQLTTVTAAALAHAGCVGWSLCDYDPDLDADAGGAERLVRFVRESASAATAHDGTRG